MEKASYDGVADRIRRDIPAIEGAVLPPSTRLARQYDVSVSTVQKALAVLAREGLVRTRQGRRTRIVRGASQGHPLSNESSETAADRVCGAIREEIRDGAIRVGHALPKVGYFVQRHRAARRTVVEALARLGHEGLIHHQGKQWVAGPPPSASKRPRGGFPGRPTVLLVMKSDREWDLPFTDAHQKSFFSSLNAEVTRMGVRLQIVFQSTAEPARVPFASGIDRVRETIRSLGDSYEGTLFVSEPASNPDLAHWIPKLTAYRRPVVLFDYSGNGGDLAGGIDNRPKRFFRLFLDEPASVACAVSALVDAGHRRIAFLRYTDPDFGWVAGRIALAREYASSLGAQIMEIEQPEQFLNLDKELQRDHLYVGDACRFDGADDPGMRVPGFRSLSTVLSSGCTALVAANDRLAREYYLRLTDAGIHVPGDISMISFDNIPESVLVPVTTVDFGFARLGYLAARVFIGDVSVHSDRHGNVAGRPILVERGSVKRNPQ